LARISVLALPVSYASRLNWAEYPGTILFISNNPCYAEVMNHRPIFPIASIFILIVFVSGCVPAAVSPTASVQPRTTPLELSTRAPSGETTLPPVVVVTPTAGETTVPFLPTPGSDFCAAPTVQALITSLVAALNDQDGANLAGLVDPVSGLDIYYRLANPAVHIGPDEIPGLFTSTFAYTWGDQAGSGLPVEGTFSAEILPLLVNVTDRTFVQSCQDLTRDVGTGPTTALVDWPVEFAGMPYIALFRAPAAGENELDWRTWAVGFTVIDGQPKVRVLVQYFWEI